ncbi:MAG: uroporphyrinogen decarboxylase family protein [Armatimonadota bacterium]
MMQGRERMLTALRGERPDRVPIFLRDLTLGLDLCDFSTPQVSAGYDADRAAEAVLTSRRRFHQDAVVGCIHDLGLDVEPLGGRVEFPERGIPFIREHPLAEDEAAAAAEPFDPAEAGRWPQVEKAYRLVRQRLGDSAAVAANVEGPVTRAGLLRGLERLAMDLATDRGMAQRLVELSTEIAVRHVPRLLEAGADFIFIAAASDGPAVISPRDYLELTIPGLRRIVRAAGDAPVVFHPHGRFTDPRFQKLVDAAIDCGIAGFQFGEHCDLAVARERWGDRICILGGPDIPEVLLPGPPERVREVTRECLQQAMGDGGYVLMASCSLHRGAPLEHLDAMVQTVLDEGGYG